MPTTGQIPEGHLAKKKKKKKAKFQKGIRIDYSSKKPVSSFTSQFKPSKHWPITQKIMWKAIPFFRGKTQDTSYKPKDLPSNKSLHSLPVDENIYNNIPLRLIVFTSAGQQLLARIHSFHSRSWQDICFTIKLVTEVKLYIDCKWDRLKVVADLGWNIWMMLDGITTNI